MKATWVADAPRIVTIHATSAIVTTAVKPAAAISIRWLSRRAFAVATVLVRGVL